MSKGLFGGKPFESVIQRDENASGTLIWMHPDTVFNTNSRVVLGLNEVAIVQDMYHNRTHILEESSDLITGNFPIIERVASAFTGGVSKYQCRIYFVSTNVFDRLEWGIQGLGPYEDTKTGMHFNIGICGDCSFKVCDHKKLTKLISGNTTFTPEDLMKRQITGAIKSQLQKYVTQLTSTIKFSIDGLKNQINSYEERFRDFLQENVFDEYGLKLSALSIIDTRVDEKFDKKIEERDKIALQIGAMDEYGQKYMTVRVLDIAEKAAASGGIAGTMASAGLGYSLGGSMGDLLQGTLSGFGQGPVPTGPQPIDAASLCAAGPMPTEPSPIGQPTQSPTIEPEDSLKLDTLKQMLDRHEITESVYISAIHNILAKYR